MQKILYAKALDDIRTAVVIDTGNGKIIGGVAILNYFSNKYKPGNTLQESARYIGIEKSTLDLVWEWNKVVSEHDLHHGVDRLFTADIEPEPPPTITIETKKIKKGKPGK